MGKDAIFSLMAQISATFLTIVFVGFSFYLESIRQATDEVKKLVPSVEEATSSIVYVMVGYNLSTYGIALLLCLVFLAANQNFVYTIQISLFMITLWLLLFELVLSRPTVSRQIRSLEEGKPRLWYWIQARIWFVRASFLVSAIFILLDVFKNDMVFWGVVVNILVGITFSVMDWVVFRPRNVLFYTKSIRDLFDGIAKDLRLKLEDATNKYGDFKRELEKHPVSHSKLVAPFLRSMDEQYRLISTSPLLESTYSVLTEKPVVSMEEIVGYYLGYKMLMDGIINFLSKIQDAWSELDNFNFEQGRER